MIVIETEPVLTTDDLLAMPENGVERDLIRGRLVEKPITRRNYLHSSVTVNVGYYLKGWVSQQPEPRGRVLGGEAGFRIRRNPDTTVGIDIAYIDADLAARTPKKASLVDGPPVLAVEILSPSDKQEEITDKVSEYLDAGVALVWVIEPVFGTVQVFRPGAVPETFNSRQELTGEPHLPGFRVPVARLFED